MIRSAEGPVTAVIAAVGLMVATGCLLEEHEHGDDNQQPVLDDSSHQYMAYYYVMVEDETPPEADSSGMSGADIHGVQIRRSTTVGGGRYSAGGVHSVGFGPGDNSHARDATQAMGPPEDGCDAQVGNFVSLGGIGGFLVVSFVDDQGVTQAIQEGDTICVFECPEGDDRYKVYTGVRPPASDPNWHLCGQSMTGNAMCVVAGLPKIPYQ